MSNGSLIKWGSMAIFKYLFLLWQNTDDIKLTILTTCQVPGGSDGKESACHAGDLGSIPGLGRSPGVGNGNPPKYSCLENPMDRGGGWAAVHGVTEELDMTKRLN